MALFSFFFFLGTGVSFFCCLQPVSSVLFRRALFWLWSQVTCRFGGEAAACPRQRGFACTILLLEWLLGSCLFSGLFFSWWLDHGAPALGARISWEINLSRTVAAPLTLPQHHHGGLRDRVQRDRLLAQTPASDAMWIMQPWRRSRCG